MNNINRENKLIIIVSNSELSNDFIKHKLCKLVESLQENNIKVILHNVSTMQIFESSFLEIKNEQLINRLIQFNYSMISVLIKRQFPTSIFIDYRNVIDPWEFDINNEEEINHLIKTIEKKKKRLRFTFIH